MFCCPVQQGHRPRRVMPRIASWSRCSERFIFVPSRWPPGLVVHRLVRLALPNAASCTGLWACHALVLLAGLSGVAVQCAALSCSPRLHRGCSGGFSPNLSVSPGFSVPAHALRCRSYGEVYRARDLRTGNFVAVKVVPVETDLGDLLKEIDVLKRCHSEYIVGYFGSYMGAGELYVRLPRLAAAACATLYV
jgi:hypothetical protein